MLDLERLKCECGGTPEIKGCDHLNDHGPWNVTCPYCGKTTNVWATQNKALKQWRAICKNLKT